MTVRLRGERTFGEPHRARRLARFEPCSSIGAAVENSASWVEELGERMAGGLADRRSSLWLGASAATPVTETVLVMALGLGRAGSLHQAVLEWSPGAPVLAKLLGIEARVGGDDVVTGRASVEGSLVYSASDRLAVVPLARGRVAREGRTRERLYDLVAALERSFDRVYITGGSLPPVDSDAALAARVGGVVLVSRVGEARALKSGSGVERLERAGATMHGLVLAERWDRNRLSRRLGSVGAAF